MVEGKPEEGAEACAICMDSDEFILMPCCGNENAKDRFCGNCIKVICDNSTGAVGKCPKCRKSIAVEEGTVIVSERKGPCRMCCHAVMVLVHEDLCDACYVGTLNTLTYECDKCHRQ